MPRSGSTFLWQIIKEMININNVDFVLDKKHGGACNKEYDILFFTCRDIFDITKSLCITHNLNVEQLLNKSFYLNYLKCFNSEYKSGFLIKYEQYIPYNEKKLIEYVYNIIFKKELSKKI